MTFLPSLVASLPHLRSLEVSACTRMVEDVFSILDGCPSSLERLALDTILRRRNELDQGDSVNNPDYPSIPSIAKPLRLKYLSMPYSAIQGTMEGILSRLAVHSLQEFDIKAAYCLRISPTIRDALWRLTSLTVQEKQLGHEQALPGIVEAIHPHQLRRANMDRTTTECIAKLIEKQHQSLESLSAQEFDLNGLAFCGSWNFDRPAAAVVCTELEVFEGCVGLALPIHRHVSGRLVSNKSVDATRIEEQFMRRLGRLTNLRCFVQNDRGRLLCSTDERADGEERGVVPGFWARTSAGSREPTDIQGP
ncbi:MAG: hypothetical protein J3Q66DRAFT_374991 [Benniella sp.]|nr:MAG: hypothetical protein J3Q66DRAFT_374991 [Benniella sp.]